MFNVAVYVSNPDGVYSGGRYHGLMVTEALAKVGCHTYYVTNRLPVFWNDFKAFPNHNEINCLFGWEDANKKLPNKLDYVFIVPGTSDKSFYDHAINSAKKRNAKIVLINFETENWFNQYAPKKKASEQWSDWKKVASAASIILSITDEGGKYAKEYYTEVPASISFATCYPPINTKAADDVIGVMRKKQILLLARFSGDTHKGGSIVDKLIDENLRGYKLAILVGTGVVPDKEKADIENECAKFGVEIEWYFKLSETEKFKLYKESEVLVFPSYFEGYGYPPIEARYCGCKVVAFDLPVLRETCGDDIFLAKHGDFLDFKLKLEQAISSKAGVSGYRLQELAPLSSTVKKLEALLLSFKEVDPDYSCYERAYSSRVQNREESTLLTQCAIGIKIVRKLFKRNKGTVTYFPKFQENKGFSNHYYRAAWYLPEIKGIVSKVNMYLTSNCAAKPELPPAMADSAGEKTHIKILRGKLNYLKDLLFSDVIMVTNGEDLSNFWVRLIRSSGIPVVNVDTNDVKAKEYGDYPGAIWRFLIDNDHRKSVIDNSYNNLSELTSKLKARNVRYAAVFGTGPSLDNAYDYSFDNTFTVVCNSTVQNDQLMDHINPLVVAAGDAVSHFGVSQYAAQFREDLVRVLKSRDIYYFGTATFGYLLQLHYPDLAQKFILIEQKTDGPNFDLLATFSAPKLDSTMNIHMLPLAATFADDIFILGCDGKAPKKDNEDFWAHSKAAQYHDLVDTGHICHPTFDIHRKQSTYSRHLDSVRSTLEQGEQEFHKRYTSLRKSYIPAFSERNLDESWYRDNFESNEHSYKISDVASKLGLIQEQGVEDSLRLEIKLSISSIGMEKNIFKTKGWLLVPFKNPRMHFEFDNGIEFYLPKRTKRPDITNKHTEYTEQDAGIDFSVELENIPSKVRISVLSGLDVKHQKDFKLTRDKV